MIGRLLNLKLRDQIHDNGSEYVSREMKACSSELGNVSCLAVPDKLYEKGRTDRLNHTLNDLDRSLTEHWKL